MTPDRWRRITDVFHLVKSRPIDARTALLDDACGDDLAMRADVEALLAANSKAGRFGETPVFASDDQHARLEPGARLGHYRVDSLIGHTVGTRSAQGDREGQWRRRNAKLEIQNSKWEMQNHGFLFCIFHFAFRILRKSTAPITRSDDSRRRCPPH